MQTRHQYGYCPAFWERVRLWHSFLFLHISQGGEGGPCKELLFHTPLRTFMQVVGCSDWLVGLGGALESLGHVAMHNLPPELRVHLIRGRLATHGARLLSLLRTLARLALLRVVKGAAGGKGDEGDEGGNEVEPGSIVCLAPSVRMLDTRLEPAREVVFKLQSLDDIQHFWRGSPAPDSPSSPLPPFLAIPLLFSLSPFLPFSLSPFLPVPPINPFARQSLCAISQLRKRNPCTYLLTSSSLSCMVPSWTTDDFLQANFTASACRTARSNPPQPRPPRSGVTCTSAAGGETNLDPPLSQCLSLPRTTPRRVKSWS